MSDETAKTNKIRNKDFFQKYLSGKVIDIGCGRDPVTPSAEPYDAIYGHPNAQEIARHRLAESYDTIYSSHCLEHMEDVPAALAQWWRLVRPGGYLVLVVPDEDLYEQGFWPSRFNPDHKATFRLKKRSSWSSVSYNIEELVQALPCVQVLSAQRQDAGYIHALQWKPGRPVTARPRRKGPHPRYSVLDFILDRLHGCPVDQTLGRALAQIQVVCKKLALILIFFSLISVPALAENTVLVPRGLFVSALENPSALSSRQAITDLVSFAKKVHAQTLFVQIYRANKSWFPSRFADQRPYEGCLKNVGEDPFSLLIQKAHAEGIQVHAWLNLLSLSANEDAPILKKYGPGILTRNREDKKTLADYRIDNQYFLEPGDLRVQDTLSGIVGEIVRAYSELDGIQLDYIRYPDVHPDYGYTAANLQRFKQATGLSVATPDSPAWKRWKYDQVTGLVRRLFRKAHSIHPGIQVSTTGLMSYSRASLESFQDWRLWLKTGLVDFVTLMCYGNNLEEFEKQLKDAADKTGDLKKVNIAVGTYKFLKTPEVFKQQFAACQEADPRSCVIFFYGSTLQNSELTRSLE